VTVTGQTVICLSADFSTAVSHRPGNWSRSYNAEAEPQNVTAAFFQDEAAKYSSRVSWAAKIFQFTFRNCANIRFMVDTVSMVKLPVKLPVNPQSVWSP